MVGNMRRFCSARTCFRADRRDFAEGGAFSGMGVDRPLRQGDTTWSARDPQSVERLFLAMLRAHSPRQPTCRQCRLSVAFIRICACSRCGPALSWSRSKDAVLLVAVGKHLCARAHDGRSRDRQTAATSLAPGRSIACHAVSMDGERGAQRTSLEIARGRSRGVSGVMQLSGVSSQ